jgi:L-alanine-DL-glutamate epimerase-like enolase superfamily enzyme
MQNYDQVKIGKRRNFLKQSAMGLAGGLLASGNANVLANGQSQNSDDSLKIVKVEPILLTGLRASAPWVFVRVETADGFVGWGEGTNYPGVRPIATAVSTLSSVIIGQSAWNIEAIWQRMYRFMYYNGMGGVVLAAISGIDMALYDIVAKKLGVPVYKMLGGLVHDKLRTYANGCAHKRVGGQRLHRM